MIKIIDIVKASDIPPQFRGNSGRRNGLTKVIQNIATDLPPVGHFVKVSHDFPYSTMMSARAQNVIERYNLDMQVIVRGSYAFFGRRITPPKPRKRGAD